MRLQLRGLREPDRDEEGRAAEPVRAGRQGDGPHAEVALRGARQGACGRGEERGAGGRSRIRSIVPDARQSGHGEIPRAHAAQSRRLGEDHVAHRHRSRPRRHRLHRRRLVRHLSDQRARVGRGGHQGARCPGGFPDRRAHAARRADRRRIALAGTRHAVPALFLPHRRRAAAKGEGTRGRRRPGR